MPFPVFSTIRKVVVAACLLPLLGLAKATASQTSVNFDFEAGVEEGWNMPENWRVSQSKGRNGSHGLVWESHDVPSRGYWWSQQMALEPGATYRFGAWIKTDSLVQGDKPPRVMLAWTSANGRFLGEADTKPVLENTPGTEGWVRHEGVTPPLPATAAYGRLLCRVGKGSVGKVRFDDLSFHLEAIRPVDMMISSAYRNVAESGPVSFHVSLRMNPVKHPLNTLSAVFSYLDAGGARCEIPAEQFTNSEAAVTLDAARLAIGTQDIAFRIVSKADNSVLGETKCRFTRGHVRRRVSFDRFGHALLDGRKFLPVGMYAARLDADTITKYTNGIFNCIMPYSTPTREQLDAAFAAGLMVAFPLLQWHKTFEKTAERLKETVAEFKAHPAVLAWYMSDEAPLSRIDDLRRLRSLVCAMDKDHPAWSVTDKPWHVRPFIGAYDVIGMDPYPIGNHRGGIDIASGWALEARAGTFGVVPMWHVPQCFNWKWYREKGTENPDFRFPRRDELFSMVWQPIAAGANGLVGYAFHAMRRELKGDAYDAAMRDVVDAFGEVKSKASVILSDPGPAVTSSHPGVIVRTWRTCDGFIHALAVNTTRKPVNGDLNFSDGYVERYDLPALGYDMKARTGVRTMSSSSRRERK